MRVKVNENEPSAKKVKQQKHRPMSDCCHCVFQILYALCINSQDEYRWCSGWWIWILSLFFLFLLCAHQLTFLLWIFFVCYYIIMLCWLLFYLFVKHEWKKIYFICVLGFSLSRRFDLYNDFKLQLRDHHWWSSLYDFSNESKYYFWFASLLITNVCNTENCFQKRNMQFIVCHSFW